MTKHQQTEKIFLLKDVLFNEAKVKKIAGEIKSAYPDFKEKIFVTNIIKEFKDAELMQRIFIIKDQLKLNLPEDYKKALSIILKALPPPLDPKKTDNDFGDFIYAPYSYFVADFGCTKEYLTISLKALTEITKRFSAEGALRNFLNQFPNETLAFVEKWTRDNNYHVRRLASEGTRPYLPWAKKINVDPKLMFPILNTLHSDKTRYVTRSVANHLNDLSKKYPDLVIKTLVKWNKEKKQEKTELDFITKHALRTLIKQGNSQALEVLGFKAASVKVIDFSIKKSEVKIGEALQFSLKLKSKTKEPQNLKLSYLIYFRKANGTLAPKVFDLGKQTLSFGEEINVSKNHPLRLMSTRVLYEGEHRLEIMVNGKNVGEGSFFLIGKV